jgi:L-asparaginase
MESTPHVMLVGDGAARFAAEVGEAKVNLLSDEARRDYEKWLSDHLSADRAGRWPAVPLAPLVRQPVRRTHRYAAESAESGPPNPADMPHGTTVFLVRTANGSLAGGASTSGWAYKYPGRISDSCIIGAGLYVDDRYGAAACTHTGEMIIRAGVARAVVAYMKRGATVEEACREAFDDLRSLRGGTIGPVLVHALDPSGRVCVLTTGDDGSIPYWFWQEGMGTPECLKPRLERL